MRNDIFYHKELLPTIGKSSSDKIGKPFEEGINPMLSGYPKERQCRKCKTYVDTNEIKLVYSEKFGSGYYCPKCYADIETQRRRAAQ